MILIQCKIIHQKNNALFKLCIFYQTFFFFQFTNVTLIIKLLE